MLGSYIWAFGECLYSYTNSNGYLVALVWDTTIREHWYCVYQVSLEHSRLDLIPSALWFLSIINVQVKPFTEPWLVSNHPSIIRRRPPEKYTLGFTRRSP